MKLFFGWWNFFFLRRNFFLWSFFLWNFLLMQLYFLWVGRRRRSRRCSPWRSRAGCQSRSQGRRSTWRGRTGKRRGSAGGSKRRGRRESKTTTHGWHVDEGERLKDDLSQCGCDASVRSTNTQQRAGVLSPKFCACWCTSCHCCHCPHWSWRCCCRHVSGDVLFTPPVGDSRLRWLLPI